MPELFIRNPADPISPLPIRGSSNRHSSRTNRQNPLSPAIDILLCFIAGICCMLAFAPFYLWPLSIFSSALLIHRCSDKRARSSFILGLSFGVGLFGFGCYWLFISIHHYGGAPLLVAIPLFLLFAMGMALFIAFYTYILQLFWPGHSGYKLLCFYPASWMLWEAVRCHLFSGFPWLLLGYAQSISPLRGYAPIIGVYGLSFVVCFLAGTLVYLTGTASLRRKIIAVISAIALIIIAQCLIPIRWTHTGKRIKVSLIQGNISQTIKWEANETQRILNRYATMTSKVPKDTKIIIWPEAAIPVFPQWVPEFMKDLQAYATRRHLSLLVGAPSYEGNMNHYFNSFLLLGNTRGKYYKRHLVPFGEYFPLAPVSDWILKLIHLPMSSFTPGSDDQKPLLAQHIPLAIYICYEIAFPQLVINAIQKRQLIITISDDSWFGRSIASAQHLQMGAMQSIVTGRDQLFSTNNGITALINQYGKIIKHAPPHQPAILSGQVTAQTGKTPIMYYGYAPLLYLAGLVLLLGFFYERRK